MRHARRTCCEPRQLTWHSACDTSATAGTRAATAVEACPTRPTGHHVAADLEDPAPQPVPAPWRPSNAERHKEARALLNRSPCEIAALLSFAVQELGKRLGEAAENIDKDLRALVDRSGLIRRSFDLHQCRSGQPLLKDSRFAGRVRAMPRAPIWRNQTIGRFTPMWMAICRTAPPCADGRMSCARSMGLCRRLRSETIAARRSPSARRGVMPTA